MAAIGTASPPVSSPPISASVRAGLALSALIGASNVAFIWVDIDWGNQVPPTWVLVVQGVIGFVSVAAAAAAWRAGSRMAIRIDAAALIVNGLATVPGFFLDVTAGVRLLTSAIVLTTVLSVVLIMRRERGPLSVDD